MAAYWRTPATQEPGITPERLEGGNGPRAYDKETGRLAQYGLTQQTAMWPTPAEQMIAGEDLNATWTPGSKPIRSDGKKLQTALTTTTQAWTTPVSEQVKEGDTNHQGRSLNKDVRQFSLQAPPTRSEP